MSDLATICAEAGGAVPVTARTLTVRCGTAVKTLSLPRVPTVDELLALEAKLDAAPSGPDGYTSSLSTSIFEERWTDAQRAFASQPVPVMVSVMPMTAPTDAVRTRVDVACLGSFLHEVGERAVASDIDDVQFFMGCVYGGSKDDIESISGIVIDIDVAVADPAELHLEYGAPTPNVVFGTEHGGARLVYAFSAEYGLETAETLLLRADLFDQLMLAFPGVDPRCGEITQRQYLPAVWRTTKGPRRRVSREPVLLSTKRLVLDDVRPGLPHRVLEALDLTGTAVSEPEREEIEHYLDQLGTPPGPAGARSPLYASCPLKEHDAPKTYVNKAPDGRISVHCLGGHGGVGAQHWNERDLLALARGEA